MNWRELLQADTETVTLPWVGGGSLHSASRTYKILKRPRKFGWYRFDVDRNAVDNPQPAEPIEGLLGSLAIGYLVGDRIVRDHVRIDPDPSTIATFSERVYLLPDALDRFSRICAGRIYPEGPLIFLHVDFPRGPEAEVMNMFLDRGPSVLQIRGVTPGLDAAFRMETLQREHAEERRAEIARLRAEEEERLAREARQREIVERLGDGKGRRVIATEDFEQAARAALAVGGAQYLDHRQHGRRGEYAVKYRVDGTRLECICDEKLRIIDAGVCLTDHATGVKGDDRFTLESLPSVIREAIELDKLVIWRHA